MKLLAVLTLTLSFASAYAGDLVEAKAKLNSVVGTAMSGGNEQGEPCEVNITRINDMIEVKADGAVITIPVAEHRRNFAQRNLYLQSFGSSTMIVYHENIEGGVHTNASICVGRDGEVNGVTGNIGESEYSCSVD